MNRTLAEIESDIDKNRDEFSALEAERHAAQCDTFRLVPNETVIRLGDGRVGVFVRIDYWRNGRSPWLRIQLRKKDGKLSSRTVCSYDKWEIMEGGS